MEDYHAIAGTFASVLAIAASIPYIISVQQGKTKPHLFSWFIWFSINVIAFSAQIADGAGPGAWVTLTSGLAALYVFIMALRIYKTLDITRSDWIAFVLSLAGIPLWIITKEPLAAAITVTFVNLMAYIPTIRKVWHHPETENGPSFVLHTSKWWVGIFGLTQFNLTTLIYPLIIGLANAVTVIVIYSRRKRLS